LERLIQYDNASVGVAEITPEKQQGGRTAIAGARRPHRHQWIGRGEETLPPGVILARCVAFEGTARNPSSAALHWYLSNKQRTVYSHKTAGENSGTHRVTREETP
jgi:hypothetical protein